MAKGGLRQQDTALTKTKKNLLEAADDIGRHMQYYSPGFLKNARQVIPSNCDNVLSIIVSLLVSTHSTLTDSEKLDHLINIPCGKLSSQAELSSFNFSWIIQIYL